jgi:hypothetical protein
MRDGHQIASDILARLRREGEHPDRHRPWPQARLTVDELEELLAVFADELLDEFQDRLNERLESVRL